MLKAISGPLFRKNVLDIASQLAYGVNASVEEMVYTRVPAHFNGDATIRWRDGLVQIQQSSFRVKVKP